MRLLRSSHFWILVCLYQAFSGSIGLAASTTQPAKPKIETPVQEETSPEDPDSISRKESTNLSYPRLEIPSTDLVSAKVPKVIYKNPDGGIHLGGLSGNTLTSQAQKMSFAAGAYFVFQEAHGFDQFEINLQSDQVINIAIAKRWPLSKYEDQMKPYWTAGLINYMDAKEGLAGIVNAGHFKVRGAVGLSDLFDSHEKYYTEMGVGFGLSGIAIDVKAGTTFSF